MWFHRRGFRAAVFFMAGQVSGQDKVEPSDHAFVELSTDRQSFYPGQTMRVRIRFGIERGFLGSNIVQLFRQSLAMPVQLHVKWLRDLAGTVALPEPAADPRDQVTFALDDRVTVSSRTTERRADGRQYSVLQVERQYRVTKLGELTIPGPRLRFAFATSFRDDLIAGRVAEDRQVAHVDGAPLTVMVRALPTTGQPPSFRGAIGSFLVSAEVSPKDVVLGAGLALVLRITGSGDASTFEPPDLRSFADFHVRGKIDDRGQASRTIRYDLMPLHDTVRAVPSIPFAFFDPSGAGGYRTVRTAAIPIRVRPLPLGEKLDIPGVDTTPRVPGKNDLFDIKQSATIAPVASPDAPPGAMLMMLLALPWLLALGFRFVWRARNSRRQPDRLRSRQASAEFREHLSTAGADVAAALAGYVAARLGSSVAAVISHDLPRQLEDAGVPLELAVRVAETLHDLGAARYGGATAASGRDVATELVAALDDSFLDPPLRRS